MNVQSKSCIHFISDLSVKSVLKGKVKKAWLTECLRKVSNSRDKMAYGECAKDIDHLKDILSIRGSKVLTKKVGLLESILSCSVKSRNNIDALQHCMIDMRFKREQLWAKDFGLRKKNVDFRPTDDLARKLKFELLKRDFIKGEQRIICATEKNLPLK